jgi:hypothetical protein
MELRGRQWFCRFKYRQFVRFGTPEFYASLNEHFESFSNGSAVNLHSGLSGGSPIMIHVTTSDIFQSQSPKPILGSRRDSHDSAQIRIPYFRWFGPTGIVPGFTKVLEDLRQTGSEKSASTTSSPAQTIYPATPHPQAEGGLRNTIPSDLGEQNEPSLFDDEVEMVPDAEILVQLLPIFFDFFDSHFPFYKKDRFIELARQKSVPVVLLNSMCALTSRFSNHPRIQRDPIYLCGELFGNKAKQIIVVLLAVPSYDLVGSLLMLSWYEFGCIEMLASGCTQVWLSGWRKISVFTKGTTKDTKMDKRLHRTLFRRRTKRGRERVEKTGKLTMMKLPCS